MKGDACLLIRNGCISYQQTKVHVHMSVPACAPAHMQYMYMYLNVHVHVAMASSGQPVMVCQGTSHCHSLNSYMSPSLANWDEHIPNMDWLHSAMYTCTHTCTGITA